MPHSSFVLRVINGSLKNFGKALKKATNLKFNSNLPSTNSEFFCQLSQEKEPRKKHQLIINYTSILLEKNISSAIDLLEKLPEVVSRSQLPKFTSEDQFENVLTRFSHLSIDLRVFLALKLFKALSCDRQFLLHYEKHINIDELSINDARRIYLAILRFSQKKSHIQLLKAPNYQSKYTKEFLIKKGAAILGAREKRAHTLQDADQCILFFFGTPPIRTPVGAHLKVLCLYVMGYCNRYIDEQVVLFLPFDNMQFSDFNENPFPPLSEHEINTARLQIYELFGGSLPANLKLKLRAPFQKDYVSDCIEDLASIQPKIAFTWLGKFSSSLFLYPISKICPVVSIQFNTNHHFSDYSDIMLTIGDLKNFQEGNKQAINHPLPIIIDKQPVMGAERENYSFSELTIVSVLSKKRMLKAFESYDASFLDSFISIFTATPQLKLFLIGSPDETKIKLVDERLSKLIDSERITILTWVDNLQAFYESCTLYVHFPGFPGGGQGIAMAIDKGLPILTMSGTDACNFLPCDSIYHTEQEFIEKLDGLLRNPDMREELAEKQCELIKTHTPERSAEFLNEIIQKALDPSSSFILKD